MNFLTSILPAIFVLGILIIIHEFGHFLACRISKVKVEKFSIGFGPEIFHWQGGETRYVVSLFPLGGYVKPAGESVSEVEGGVPKPGDYLAASLPARIFIVAAGVLMNYLLAFFLFVAIFLMGRPIPGTTIGTFVEGYPAQKSGLQLGDRIVKIDGRDVHTWMELTSALEKASHDELEVVAERKETPVIFQIAPKVDEVKDIFGHATKIRRLGITPSQEAFEFERYGFSGAVVKAWEIETFLTVMTHKALFYLVLGKLSMKTISGPIGIITMTGNAFKLGIPYMLQLMANLSVSLAVFNLLPMPSLDGGHLLFLLIEAVRRKRLSLEAQERATQVGFVLLLAFAGFVIYNDLVNIDAFMKIKNILIRH